MLDPRRTLFAFLTYMAVGLIGTAVHYLTLVVLVQRLGADPVVASAMGFAAGAVTNYYANYYITFRSRKRHFRTLLQFISVAIGGLVVNTAVMALAVRGLSLHYLVGQVAATGTVVVITFVANRLWTFREA